MEFSKKDKNIINLILFITKYQKINIVQEKIKYIFYDEFNLFSEQERFIKRLCNSSNYIFYNINQSFTKELIIQTYFLLTNELLENEIATKITELYYKNIDVAPHSLAALLHLHITNNIIKNNIEFAYLISNYVMLKKNRWFLMPYEYCHNDYREAIKSNDLSSLIRIFYDIELVKKEKKPCLLSRDEVIQNIKVLNSKYTPDELINKLDDLGFSKEVTFKSASSGPSTIMKRGNLTFRIQVAPANDNAYFRVMNSGGNCLSANGSVLSEVSKQAFRNLTHFYF